MKMISHLDLHTSCPSILPGMDDSHHLLHGKNLENIFRDAVNFFLDHQQQIEHIE